MSGYKVTCKSNSNISPDELGNKNLRWCPAQGKSDCRQPGSGLFLPWPQPGGLLCQIISMPCRIFFNSAGPARQKCATRLWFRAAMRSKTSLALSFLHSLSPPFIFAMGKTLGKLPSELCYFNRFYVILLRCPEPKLGTAAYKSNI